jgi:hypothetical protein
VKSHRTIPAALAAFLLAVLAIVLWQGAHLRQARARRAAAALGHEGVLRDIRALRASLAELLRREDELRPSAPEGRKAEPPSEADEAAQLQQRRVRILKAWLALRNAALYRRLNATPAQIASYEDLVVNHFLRMQDIAEAAQAEKMLRTDPAIVQMESDENGQYVQQLQQLGQALDPGMAQAVADFEKLSPARSLVDAVAGNLYNTDDPLTPQQADQLTQILANNSAHYVGGRHVDMNDLNMPAAITQAQAVLSPTQVAALANIYQSNQALTQYRQVMQSLTAGNPAPGTPSAAK